MINTLKVLILRPRRTCVGFFLLSFFIYPAVGFAEINMAETASYIFSLSSYLRTDVVTLNNNVDLDRKLKDDASTYLGFDYSFGLDLKFKKKGPQFYLKLQRTGLYGYDAPLFIHNTLQTSTARVNRYKNKALLPQLKEVWADTPLNFLSLRLKSGLFAYSVGHGLSIGTYYENYGVSLYNDRENFKWRFFYFYPDLVNKKRLGPGIDQEKEQGIGYEHSKAHLFATDITLCSENNTIQPYLGILLDRTNDKRLNYFSTPTDQDILGTLGLSWDVTLGKLSLGLEGVRNFGKAKSSDSSFKDVEHVGYLIYTDATYNLDRFKPHSRFILGSGNKVAREMADNGVLTSGKNRAFSVCSPFNTNLADSLTFPSLIGPMVAMGNGWGLNYGINRPTTFGEPGLFENIILPGLGFDYQLTNKLCLTFDWWYLRALEPGVGTYDLVSKKLSADLGNEVDFSCSYTFNDHASLNLYSGYFFPGRFYKEERGDTSGSLFTPFIRGDGEADGAYQIELNLTLSF